MIQVIPNWHPIFVHFTVALLLIAVMMFVIGHLFRQKEWHKAVLLVAQWNFWIGTIAAVLTAIAGWYAYNTVVHDTPSHAAMTEHRNWALAALMMVLSMAVFLYWSQRVKRDLPALLLTGMLLVAALISITAWHGGELVYRYGLGVMSMPMAEGDGQPHGHADAGHQHESAVPAASIQESDTHHGTQQANEAGPTGGLMDAAPMQQETIENTATQKHHDGHNHAH